MWQDVDEYAAGDEAFSEGNQSTMYSDMPLEKMRGYSCHPFYRLLEINHTSSIESFGFIGP